MVIAYAEQQKREHILWGRGVLDAPQFVSTVRILPADVSHSII